MRLDKYLADCGFGTRKEVKELLRKGHVRVRGELVKDPALQVSPEGDTVCVDENPVSWAQYEYYMLNKPQGIISASRVNTLKRGEKIPEGKEQYVVDLIRDSGKTDLFPAGRLDKDTEGLQVITNDGKLSYRLLSPNHHVEKTYYAELKDPLTESMTEALLKGVDIGDEKTAAACRIKKRSEQACEITITEGRYHQVKRMFQAVGTEVLFLKRISFGPLKLDERLKPGEYRRLTEEEIQSLNK